MPRPTDREPPGIDPMLGLIHAELQFLRALAMVRTLAASPSSSSSSSR